jgi:phenylacetate-CoA ligase
VLTRIVGRERNMWSLPTGRRVWPLFSSRVWGRIEVIRQLQLVQHEIDHIEARIVGPRPLTAQEEFQLTAMLRQQFTYPFHLSFTYLDSIDRSQGLKFEDFVSRVGTRATAATPR